MKKTWWLSLTISHFFSLLLVIFHCSCCCWLENLMKFSSGFFVCVCVCVNIPLCDSVIKNVCENNIRMNTHKCFLFLFLSWTKKNSIIIIWYKIKIKWTKCLCLCFCMSIDDDDVKTNFSPVHTHTHTHSIYSPS